MASDGAGLETCMRISPTGHMSVGNSQTYREGEKSQTANEH